MCKKRTSREQCARCIQNNTDAGQRGGRTDARMRGVEVAGGCETGCPGPNGARRRLRARACRRLGWMASGTHAISNGVISAFKLFTCGGAPVQSKSCGPKPRPGKARWHAPAPPPPLKRPGLLDCPTAPPRPTVLKPRRVASHLPPKLPEPPVLPLPHRPGCLCRDSRPPTSPYPTTPDL